MKPVLVRSVAVFIIFCIGSYFGYNHVYNPEPLPIIQPSDINNKLVDISLHKKTADHRIGSFSLTNQLGKSISENSFSNKIYVANFIFTTCPKMCPLMTSNLSVVYDNFKGDPEISFISHSVTPEIDSVPQLLKFAKKYNAEAPQWHFVTGEKKQIYELARKHYFAATTNGDGGIHDFIHTENFILVDKKKRIRGIYDGTSFDAIDQLIIDLDRLKEDKL